MTEFNRKQLFREKSLFRYTQMLERGDIEGIAAILEIAETDAVLERMIIEMDEALLQQQDLQRTTSNNNLSAKKEHLMATYVPTHPTAYPTAPLRRRVLNIPVMLSLTAIITIVFGLLLLYVTTSPPATPQHGNNPVVLQGDENENLGVLSRYIDEIWNAGNIIALPELVTADHILRSGNTVSEGIPDLSTVITQLRAIAPDIELRIVETLGAGNTITADINISFILNAGTLADNIPASNTPINFTGTMVVSFEEGLITETSLTLFTSSLIEQLSVIVPEIIDIPSTQLDQLNALDLVSQLDELASIPSIYQLLLQGADSFDLISLLIPDNLTDNIESEDTSEGDNTTVMDNEPADGIVIPPLPECTSRGSLTNVQGEIFSAPLQNVQTAQVAIFVPLGNGNIHSLPIDSDNLFVADVDYSGNISFEITGDSNHKVVELLQNGNCSNYRVSSLETQITPKIPLDLNLFIDQGLLNADLDNLSLHSLNLSVISGLMNVIFPVTDTPFETAVEVDSGTLDLNLPAETNVSAFDISLRSGTINLTVSETVNLTANATITSGLFTLNVPESTGVQINLSGSGLNGIDLPDGFIEVNANTWESANFEDAEDQFALHLTFTSGRFQINH